jgi:hypothetical protein
MNDFKQAMLELSDKALVKIVEYQSDDYQPEALEVAKDELKKRNISSDELRVIRLKIENREDYEGLQTFDLDTLKSTDDLVDPGSEKPVNRKMQFLFILFSVIYIFFLIDQYQAMVISIDSILSGHNEEPLFLFVTIDYILPFVLFPVGLFSFYKGLKYGWFILIMILIYWLINLGDETFMYFKYSGMDWNNLDTHGETLQKLTYLLYIQKGWFYYVLRLTICLIAIYFLQLKTIRIHLQVKPLDYFISIFIPFALYFIVYFLTRGFGHFHL